MVIYATKSHLTNFISIVESLLAYEDPTFESVTSKNLAPAVINIGMSYWLGPIGVAMIKVLSEVGEYRQAVTRVNLQSALIKYRAWLKSMNASNFIEVKFYETNIVQKANGSKHALGVPVLMAFKNSSGNWIEQQ